MRNAARSLPWLLAAACSGSGSAGDAGTSTTVSGSSSGTSTSGGSSTLSNAGNSSGSSSGATAQSDGGNCPDWRAQRDAGLCTSSSDCPPSYYCDYVVSFCGYSGGPFIPAADGGSYLLATFDAGACRLDCPYNYQGACQVGEDCGEGLCSGVPNEPIGPTGFFCNLEEPCDAGQCIGDVSNGFGNCPNQCQPIIPAHETLVGCLCPGNTCVPPVGDGG